MSCGLERLALSCASLQRRSMTTGKAALLSSGASRALRRDFSRKRSNTTWVAWGSTLVLAHSMCGVLGYHIPAQQRYQLRLQPTQARSNWLSQPRSSALMCLSGRKDNLRGGFGVDGYSDALR
eukprot:3614330-Rhodomonas_salina.1